jgi:hypothetical protein
MTEEEFYSRLQTLPDQWWEVRLYQIHPTHVWVIKLGAPRSAWPREGEWPQQDEDFCPVTALCLAVHGVHFLPSQYLEAGEALGVDLDLVEKIVRAADHSPHHDVQVRRRLLTALGLSEAPREVA